jgi:glucokinase
MSISGIDLGATKVTFAVFSKEGIITSKETILLEQRTGKQVGSLIAERIKYLLESTETQGDKIKSIGISVPGISYTGTGTVWAPNIEGWNNYPLLQEIKNVAGDIPVIIDSDRACCILGEFWQGNARGCRNAVFLSVGTGIGAGILVNGEVLRGSNDIAGAIGWMALNKPFNDKYISCGCFEYHASGEGIAKIAREFLSLDNNYTGKLRNKPAAELTSYDVFGAYDHGDILATRIVEQCIEYWGMAVANIISLFNPEKIILGGGIFGPARKFIPEIRKEAEKWAQPISVKQVSIEESALSGDAGVYGAGYLALKKLIDKNP